MATQLPTALVVDDDADLRWLSRRILERAGFRVREAEDGVEALALLELTTPRVLVLDVGMPRLTGDQVLEQAGAKGLLEGVRVLLLSESAHVDLAHPCERLPKPMKPADLLDFARRAMHSRPSGLHRVSSK